MFTGIVQKIGTVTKVQNKKRTKTFEVEISSWPDSVKVGESIAVDGVCLTVRRKSTKSFCTDAIPATLRVTTLKNLREGSRVNLERSLRFGDRIGGHFISGHVDGVGKITSVTKQGRSKVYSVKVPSAIRKYLVPKGSIAVDGISLTIQKKMATGFETAIIPHTAKNTTIRFKKKGDPVNLEADLMYKRFFKKKSK